MALTFLQAPDKHGKHLSMAQMLLQPRNLTINASPNSPCATENNLIAPEAWIILKV